MFVNWRRMVLVAALLGLPTVSACTSTMLHDRHGGVRYTIHPDQRFHRLEKGNDGRLIYHSPEMIVTVDNSVLDINGKKCGPVQEGDHVEITEEGRVLVNGDPRGDVMTNYDETQRRLKARQRYVDGLMQTQTAASSNGS